MVIGLKKIYQKLSKIYVEINKRKWNKKIQINKWEENETKSILCRIRKLKMAEKCQIEQKSCHMTSNLFYRHLIWDQLEKRPFLSTITSQGFTRYILFFFNLIFDKKKVFEFDGKKWVSLALSSCAVRISSTRLFCKPRQENGNQTEKKLGNKQKKQNVELSTKKRFPHR